MQSTKLINGSENCAKRVKFYATADIPVSFSLSNFIIYIQKYISLSAKMSAKISRKVGESR